MHQGTHAGRQGCRLVHRPAVKCGSLPNQRRLGMQIAACPAAASFSQLGSHLAVCVVGVGQVGRNQRQQQDRVGMAQLRRHVDQRAAGCICRGGHSGVPSEVPATQVCRARQAGRPAGKTGQLAAVCTLQRVAQQSHTVSYCTAAPHTPASGRRISSAHVASCCATRCTLAAASRSRVDAARLSLRRRSGWDGDHPLAGWQADLLPRPSNAAPAMQECAAWQRCHGIAVCVDAGLRNQCDAQPQR